MVLFEDIFVVNIPLLHRGCELVVTSFSRYGVK